MIFSHPPVSLYYWVSSLDETPSCSFDNGKNQESDTGYKTDEDWVCVTHGTQNGKGQPCSFFEEDCVSDDETEDLDSCELYGGDNDEQRAHSRAGV